MVKTSILLSVAKGIHIYIHYRLDYTENEKIKKLDKSKFDI